MRRTFLHWVPLVAAVLSVALFVALGIWQLGRAEDKAELESAHSDRTRDVPIYLNNRADDLAGRDIDAGWWRFRPVEVSGHYVRGRHYLLDNRTRNGVPGYHVYSPFRLDGERTVVMVNRGWTPADPVRTRLPEVALDGDPDVVLGTVDLARHTLLLGEDGFGEGRWPRVVQRMDLERVADDLKSPVLPVVVLLDEKQPYGFSREWTPYLGITADRHRAYAFQWFTLAAAIVVLTVVIQRRGRRAGT